MRKDAVRLSAWLKDLAQAKSYAAGLPKSPAADWNFRSVIGPNSKPPNWGVKTVEILAGMIPNLKVEVLTPVLCKGFPSENDFRALDELAAAIAGKHKEHNFN